jgi:CBS domain-containing protein
MFNDPVRRVMAQERMLQADPQMSVREAAQQMAATGIGAMLVVEDGLLAGIFTENDAVARVVALGLDPRNTPLHLVMTPKPVTIGPDVPFGYALQLMHEHGFRHIPVVEADRPIGIVTSRDAMDPEMEEFICETQRREGFR